jgi:NDP-sugar pyrophosphorylase family protein
MVADDQGAVLHFAEKPETFVSDLANCGVYVFAPEVFQRIQVATERKAQLATSHDELNLVCRRLRGLLLTRVVSAD